MTDFVKKRFSVSAPISDAYADNYERTFGHREPKKTEGDQPAPPPAHTHLDARDGGSGLRSRKGRADIEKLASGGAPRQRFVMMHREELEKWLHDLEADVFQALPVRRTAEAIKLLLYATDFNSDFNHNKED